LGETSISGPLPLAQILPRLGVLDNRTHASTLSRCRGKAMATAAASATLFRGRIFSPVSSIVVPSPRERPQ
jgi:hypothetical protein